MYLVIKQQRLARSASTVGAILHKAKKGERKAGAKYKERHAKPGGGYTYTYETTTDTASKPGKSRVTDQAQTAIDRMLASGLRRADFRVATKRKWHTDRETGRRFSEYHDAEISLADPYKNVAARAEAMIKQGLSVGIIRQGGAPLRIFGVKNNGRGKLDYTDI